MEFPYYSRTNMPFFREALPSGFDGRYQRVPTHSGYKTSTSDVMSNYFKPNALIKGDVEGSFEFIWRHPPCSHTAARRVHGVPHRVEHKAETRSDVVPEFE